MQAEHEWARLKANNSLDCSNCHDFGYMDFTRQSPRAPSVHEVFLVRGEKTYLDSKKGIAHALPDTPGVPGWQKGDGTHNFRLWL